jgi:LysR family transcriptional regulator (chromosome initiation inhibitor)
MAAFSNNDRALLDIAVDDQEHTIEWLRSGEVLAAVTSSSRPVQGCDSALLGRLRYVAVASPAYIARHFADGVNATTLASAPCLTFNRKDQLQAEWVRRVCRRSVDTPKHWLPSTQGFTDASVAGIGWGMNPVQMVQNQLRDGSLVELVPGKTIVVPLYWQHTRLQVPLLDRLTRAVVATARKALR